MNVERRSALGLSIAALMGGMVSPSMASPRDADVHIIKLCNQLSKIGFKRESLLSMEGLTEEEVRNQEPVIARLYREEDQLAEEIFEAELPRSLDGFSAMARAILAISPVDIGGEVVLETDRAFALAEHMLRALAGRETVA